MLCIPLPKPTLSLNVLGRMHWAQKSKLRDEYCLWIRLAVLRAGTWPRSAPKGIMQVAVARHSAHSLDHDNFVGGCKPLMDALVIENVILDDAPAYMTAQYEQLRIGSKASKGLNGALVRVARPGVILAPLAELAG